MRCVEDGLPVLNVDLMEAKRFFRCFSAHGDGLPVPYWFHKFFRCELIAIQQRAVGKRTE